MLGLFLTRKKVAKMKKDKHLGKSNDNVLIVDFLRESNAIEGVYDEDSLALAHLAWAHLMSQPELTISVILECHNILMQGKLEDSVRGHWRRCAVWIGGREGLLWVEISRAMYEWLKEPANNWEQIKNRHVEFEKIHPFIDGNGRVGRMLMQWQRIKAGLPILVIEEGEKQSYYQWFKD